MSRFFNTHYSYTQRAGQLNEWANDVAFKLLEEVKATGRIPVLMYSGMSGVSSATALALAYSRLSEKDPMMVYVRKKGEQSHGDAVEIGSPDWVCVDREEINAAALMFVFVDDFLSTGATLEYVIRAANEDRYCGFKGAIHPDDNVWIAELANSREEHTSDTIRRFHKFDWEEYCNSDVAAKFSSWKP